VPPEVERALDDVSDPELRQELVRLLELMGVRRRP